MSLLNLSQQMAQLQISLQKSRLNHKNLTRAIHALVVFMMLIPNLSTFAAPTSEKAATNINDHPEAFSAAISTVDDRLDDIASISSNTPAEYQTPTFTHATPRNSSDPISLFSAPEEDRVNNDNLSAAAASSHLTAPRNTYEIPFGIPPFQTAPPANDDFDSAIAIPTLPFSETLDTSGATSASDDPHSQCYNDLTYTVRNMCSGPSE